MGKTSKYVTAAALCSTIVMGGLQASSVSYAAYKSDYSDSTIRCKVIR